MPLIGFLSSRSPEDSKPHLEGFLRGLEAFGYTDGKTARIEYRWANGQYDLLRKLAGELVALQPNIIVAAGGAPSARAAESVTASIPITFVAGDSVSEGVVTSLNHPGANITGVDLMSGELTGKRLGLLSQLVHPGGAIGFLTNTKGVQSSLHAEDFKLAAAGIGREPLVVGASTDEEIDRAFGTAGGLLSYGPDRIDLYRRAAGYVDRILKGEKPADMPVQAPTKYQLVINRETARVLGLNVPMSLLASADEVIE
jgi:putative ABC transport system substrate-binding protein